MNTNENSFTLLAQFNRQALKAGWSKERIKVVIDKATLSNRENLENVLFKALSELETA